MLQSLRHDMTNSLNSECPIRAERRNNERDFSSLASQYNAIVSDPTKKVLRIPAAGTPKHTQLRHMMEQALEAHAAGDKKSSEKPRMTTPNQRAKMGYDAA